MSHLSYIKVDNSISNQVKHVRVNSYTSTCMQSFYYVVSLLSNIVHIEYVTHTHMYSCQWSGIESEWRRQWLLSMFNQTPHHDEWYSSLIVVKSRTTFIFFDIKQHLQLLLFSLSLLHIEAVKYHLLFFIIKWMSIVFNCSTDVQKNITLPIIFPFVMYFGFATLVLIWKNDSICIFKL
jgi:hypothetical protein